NARLFINTDHMHARLMKFLCLGIAHLMIYFMPTIELVNSLIPAAILTTVLIVVFGEMIKSWVGNAWAESQAILVSTLKTTVNIKFTGIS
ncbi:MAG TPA: hypothetical protein VIJ25_12480, partial [Methylococcales bacterium]